MALPFERASRPRTDLEPNKYHRTRYKIAQCIEIKSVTRAQQYGLGGCWSIKAGAERRLSERDEIRRADYDAKCRDREIRFDRLQSLHMFVGNWRY